MTFTNEQVTKAIKEVVAEKGEDHVYEAKRNTPHKEAARISYSYDDCIAGCVIRKLDPELHAKMLERERILQGSWPFDSTFTSFITSSSAVLTPEQIAALRRAQDRQDSGQNWGEALKTYTETIGASND